METVSGGGRREAVKAGDGTVLGVAAGDGVCDWKGDGPWCLAMGLGVFVSEWVRGGGTIVFVPSGSWGCSGYSDIDTESREEDEGILVGCRCMSDEVGIGDWTETRDVILLRDCVRVCVCDAIRCDCDGPSCCSL